MPVLFQDFRANTYSRRHTVYSKIKRVTRDGYYTSNDFFGNNFTSNLLGLNDNSKDFFSNSCRDVIYSSDLDALIACGANAEGDKRNNLSTFMYSTDHGVSWAFAKDSFPSLGQYNGSGSYLVISDSEIFCGGSGGESLGNYVSLMKSSDGDNWTPVTACTLDEVLSMTTSGYGQILVWGLANATPTKLLLSTNNGDTFNEVNVASILTDDIRNILLYHINNSFYAVITLNNLSIVVLTISVANANTGGDDINNWTNITSNFEDGAGNPITLTGYSTSMYHDVVNNNTFILFGGGSNFIFYSTDGLNFIRTLVDTNIKAATKIVYSPTDTSYYLAVAYPESDTEPGNYTIMYKCLATDISSFVPYINTHDINLKVTSLKDVIINSVTDFYLGTNTINLVVANGFKRHDNNDYQYEYYGLVNVDIATGTINNTVQTKIDNVSKLIYNNPNLLVCTESSSQRFTNNDTIYYQGPSSTSLQETEHSADTS